MRRLLAWLRGDEFDDTADKQLERERRSLMAPLDADEVVEELMRYLRHDPACPSMATDHRPDVCTCGLTATLKPFEWEKTIICSGCGRIEQLGNTEGWMSKEDDSGLHLCEGCGAARFG